MNIWRKIADRTAAFLSSHLLIWVLVLVVAVVLCALLLRRCREDRTFMSVSIESTDTIGITPAQIRSIERIGQWEFLSIADEELVDTVRARTFSRDDRLIRIYHGTLRLGVDLSQCSDSWVRMHGDTLVAILPPVCLLSNQFIDEARTRSFYESGEWSARAKEQMYWKAVRRMRDRCLTEKNYVLAERNAIEQFTALFRTFGFQNVKVDFDRQH
ncbi:MAG: DUF4230 domain-containing protein [Bacteroidales bacterium]|nr:DUF4230 domain-containing protein [Bacteroidales bacterium]